MASRKDKEFEDLIEKYKDILDKDDEVGEEPEKEEPVDPKEKVKDFMGRARNKKNNDGFNTLNTDEIERKKDSIKKASYVKLFAIGIGSMFILALVIFFFGGKNIVQNGEKNKLGEINDSVQSGTISPNIDLFKKQMVDMQLQIKMLNDALAAKRGAEGNVSYPGKTDGNISNEVMNKPEGTVPEAMSPQDQSVVEENNRLKAQLAEMGGSPSSKEPLPGGGLAPEAPLPANEKPVAPVMPKNSKPGPHYYDYSVQTMGEATNHKSGIGDEKSLYDANGSVIATSKGVPSQGGGGDEITFDIVTGLSKALLISGVEAPTFSDGAANPKPVLLKFTSPILTANKKSINIKECNALGSAYGNMNTKRAEITVTKLNCLVEKGDKTYKVSQEVKGYVIGEDGAFGVPGRLVESGAKMVMRQLEIGFLQGVNQAFQSAVQPNVTINSYGSTSSTTMPSVSNAGKYGLVNGTNSGLNSLVEYYKSMMNGVYPVISVRAGRNISVLWNGGETLSVKATKLFNVDERDNRQKAKSGRINYNGY